MHYMPASGSRVGPVSCNKYCSISIYAGSLKCEELLLRWQCEQVLARDKEIGYSNIEAALRHSTEWAYTFMYTGP